MQHWLHDTDRGKSQFPKYNFSSDTLFTINPTWTGLNLNPGLLGERLAINYLNHGVTTINAVCRLNNIKWKDGFWLMNWIECESHQGLFLDTLSISLERLKKTMDSILGCQAAGYLVYEGLLTTQL
jgi:hypothetical protein